MDKYLTNVAIPEFDSEITEAIKSLNIELCDYGRMVIGFRNTDGQIYRKIRIEGMGNYFSFSQKFPDFGFHDELIDTFMMKDGCDSIYSYIK